MLKVFGLIVLFLLEVSGLDQIADWFNHPWFVGQAYGCVLLAVIWLTALFYATYKLLLYKSKPKEVVK